MRKATLYAAVLIAALVVPAMDAMASDTVYRWVDENGNVHFGDKPPEKTKAEIINIQSSPATNTQAASEPASAAASGQPSRAQQQRDERATRRKEDAERQEAVAAGCAQRYKLVSQLEPSTRVIIRDVETGEVMRMDDNERLKELDEAKAYIAENCNK